MLTIFYIYNIYKYIIYIFTASSLVFLTTEYFCKSCNFSFFFSCFSVHVHQSSRDILVASEGKLRDRSPSKEKLCGLALRSKVEKKRHVERLLRA